MNTRSLVNWDQVDTLLLDMDGTLLDLNYDNSFWQEHLPRHYADARGLALDAARAYLEPLFMSWRGKLEWYCVDHWSRVLELDVAALKSRYVDLIAPLPGVERFLDAAHAAAKQLWLVTNAHPASLELKMATTGFGPRFDAIISSHTLGYPKEDARFWPALVRRHPFDPARALMVDDNQSVLEAAQAYGVGQVLGITRPDTRRPARPLAGVPTVEGLAVLNPA
ncbi:MAG: GMP/IMP nucleotidase [Nevskiales bacterium]